ncbi:protein spinster homolog 1-like [Leptodactylus fuscus]|uniref:protein spinster homolog 1-like n=1 Tax=Leptodactylus fuscus TaxID=238119 RepID=UPI003F4E958A
MDEEKGYCSDPQDTHALTGVSYMRSVITVAIMSYISLLHYIERYSTSGVLPDLQKAFMMSDSVSGLLHTVFIASYTLFGLVFGYMGDRWNRKYIMCAGTLFWSIMTLCISFIPNKYFLLLLTMRALVGAGEASFSTIAPSVIADLFVADQRSRIFAFFYLTIPVGCGLGYIVGSQVVSAAGGDWHWAFRVTPGLGVIAVLLLLVFVKEPPRGAADGKNKNRSVSSNNWISDVKKLFKNRSFLFSTLGSATVAFVAGAIGLWAPAYLTRAQSLLLEKEPCQTGTCTYNDSLIFGVLTVISVILGVLAGVEISKRDRKTNPRADPLICACGMLCSAPLLFLALVLADISLVATSVLIFIVETFLAFNGALVVEILLSVVPPTRRATAGSVQISVAHLLGDVGSPYLIGFMSDLIHGGAAESTLSRYRSLKYALLTCAFMEAIGGAFFLVNAHFIEKDRKEAEMESEVVMTKTRVTSALKSLYKTLPQILLKIGLRVKSYKEEVLSVSFRVRDIKATNITLDEDGHIRITDRLAQDAQMSSTDPGGWKSTSHQGANTSIMARRRPERSTDQPATEGSRELFGCGRKHKRPLIFLEPSDGR